MFKIFSVKSNGYLRIYLRKRRKKNSTQVGVSDILADNKRPSLVNSLLFCMENYDY